MMATRTKLLLTGFEPFGGMATNPSQKVLSLVSELGVDGFELHTMVLPVEYHRAMTLIREQVAHYDLVVMLGVARSRQEISIERVAINLMDAVSADNSDYRPDEASIVPGGPSAYFSSFPVKQMAAAVKSIDIPCKVSNTAGTFVCNAVYYAALHEAENSGLNTRAVFIHLPTECAMDIATMAEGVRVAVANSKIVKLLSNK